MKTIIKNGRVIDPSQNIDRIADVVIVDGIITEINECANNNECTNNKDSGASAHADKQEAGAADAVNSADEIIDAAGMWVVPGLIDLHVHFREPGQEYKEDIKTGCEAAAAGGFTAVCTMPNTKPFADSVEVAEYIKEKERQANGVKLLQSACITEGQRGEKLTNMEALKAAGVYGFSEDGRSVDSFELMREAMKKAKELDMPILDHTEERALLEKGACMNAGKFARKAGLKGIPSEAEEFIAARDVMLSKETGCRLHLQHISTLGSIDIIRLAKKWGLPVTAETAPHYFTLTDIDVIVEDEENLTEEGCYHHVKSPSGLTVDTHKKMNPPLRTRRDRHVMEIAVIDGTIDAIATDHAPHSAEEKAKPFDEAPFGIIGLETSFSVCHTRLVKRGLIRPMRLIELMSTNPARILGYDGGTLRAGARADITVIDPDAEWTVRAEEFKSKGRNTPFEGMHVYGRVMKTMVDGKVIYSRD